MKLNLVKTTYAELDGALRCILEWQKKPFYFIRMRNTLYMNKRMKGIRKITAALETMWKYDEVPTDEIMYEIDTARSTIEQAAGEEAADQAWKAWHEMASESRIELAKADALEWIKTVYEKLDDPDWDEMCAAGYSYGFVEEGLWRAFSQLEKDNPDRPGYRNCTRNSRVAAFVYGFQMGARHRAETV